MSSMGAGKNKIVVQVINEDTGDIACETTWFGLSYPVLVVMETAMMNAILKLGADYAAGMAPELAPLLTPTVTRAAAPVVASVKK